MLCPSEKSGTGDANDATALRAVATRFKTRGLATAWCLATASAAALYLLTAAPGLLWGDSGECQLRVLLEHLYDHDQHSRSHVLFYLIACAVARMGVDPPWAATCVSAVAGAMAVGNVAVLMCELVRSRVAVACGVLALMLSHSMWHLSTVAEVNTLSVMLLSFELWLLVRFVRAKQSGWLIAAAFVNGLGFATHNFAMLMWPVYGVLMIQTWRAHQPVSWRAAAWSVLVFLIGAAPKLILFAYLVQQQGRPVNVLFEMLMGRHAPNVYNTTLSAGLLMRTAAYAAYAFPSPVILLAPVGLWMLWRRCDRLAATVLTLTFIIYFGFVARFSVPDQHVFFLHCYLVVAVMIALGADRILAKRQSLGWSCVLVASTGLAPIVYAVTPTLLVEAMPELTRRFLPGRDIKYRDNARWFLQPWNRGYRGPELFAREVLTALPQDAVLDVDSTAMPPLLYLQCAEDLRRDVRFLGGTLFQTWFQEALQQSGPQMQAAIAEGRMFTLMGDRRYWNYIFRNDRFDAVPNCGVYRIIEVDDDAPPITPHRETGGA